MQHDEENIPQSIRDALAASDPVPGVGIRHAYAQDDARGLTHHAMQLPSPDVEGKTPGRIEVHEGALKHAEDPAALADLPWRPCGSDGRVKE